MPPMPPIPPMPPAGVGAGVVGRSVTTASVVRTLWLGQDATGTTNFQMATTSWLNMIFDVIFCWTRCEHYFEHYWLNLNGNLISSNLEYKIISMIMYLNIPAWKEVRYRWVLGLLPCPQWRRHWPRNLWPPHGASALENITRTKKIWKDNQAQMPFWIQENYSARNINQRNQLNTRVVRYRFPSPWPGRRHRLSANPHRPHSSQVYLAGNFCRTILQVNLHNWFVPVVASQYPPVVLT